MHEVSNDVFLKTLFGENYQYAHITDFFDDPGNIATWRRGMCWAGGAQSEYSVTAGTNQYFCISLFNRDPDQPLRSLRRKNLFHSCPVVVADDCLEKLPPDQLAKLPAPTWRLETSTGNEQWGWILNHPETERARVENLLDGLVANGLAPAGTDPGMKGVTRFVRLPEGWNRKAKCIQPNGSAHKCRMLEWQPDRRVAIDDLAEPFSVDLNAARAETDGTLVDVVDGIDLSEHHPALQYLQIIGKIKEGAFGVVCPWVDHHAAGDESGSAVFLLGGGAVGFKCHHGHCQERSWGDVLTALPVDWMWCGLDLEVEEPILPQVSAEIFQTECGVGLADLLKKARTLSPEDVAGQQEVVVEARGLPTLEQNVIRNAVMDAGAMTGKVFDKAVKEVIREGKVARLQQDSSLGLGGGCRYVFVAEANAFWDLRAQVFVSRDGYNGMYGATAMTAEEETPAQQLLQWCPKATRLTYHPGEVPGVTEIRGVEVVNTWTPGFVDPHYEADAGPWLRHAELLIPNKRERELLYDWMAWTLQNQGRKSNWQVLLAGYQGSGKDTLFLPLKRSIGQQNSIEISADRLLEKFEDYLKTKLLIVQEVQNFEKTQVQNKLKRILASTSGGRVPDQLNIRLLGTKPISIPNLVQTIFMSNHKETALQVSRDDRRIFAIWSEFNPDASLEWEKYFTDLHTWLHWSGANGVEHSEGYGVAIVHAWLLERDVSSFNAHGKAPNTAYKDQLRKYSRTNLEMVVEDMVEDRMGPARYDLVNSTILLEWLEKNRKTRTSHKQLTTTLSKLGYLNFHDSARAKGSKKIENFRYWAVRRQNDWRYQSPRQRVDAWTTHGVKHTLFTDDLLLDS